MIKTCQKGQEKNEAEFILRIDSNERCFRKIMEGYSPMTKALKILLGG